MHQKAGQICKEARAGKALILQSSNAHARVSSPCHAQVSDGAGAVLLMTRREALNRSLPVLGIFRTFAAVGVDPAIMGIGPAVAIPAAVKAAGLTLDDIDLFELNEAFASQVWPTSMLFKGTLRYQELHQALRLEMPHACLVYAVHGSAKHVHANRRSCSGIAILPTSPVSSPTRQRCHFGCRPHTVSTSWALTRRRSTPTVVLLLLDIRLAAQV